MKLRYVKYFGVVLLLFCIFNLNAQDPNRFKSQIEELVQKEHQFETGKKLVLFTGSSSVRMWKDVADYFPEYNVINNGFGGSHFSDLIYFYDQLIKKYNPEILFIYEGDNDIAGNKRPGKVKRHAKKLHKRLKEDFPETKVIFISPKPSIARKHLQKKYERLNRRLERYCNRKENLEFADVWHSMLAENGEVYEDIFIDDGLHMNKKGYTIWGKTLIKFLE